MVFILGKKIKMTQVFEGDEVIPVTEIKAGPCFVLQIKNMAKDGYEAVQVGFDKMTKAKNKGIKKTKIITDKKMFMKIFLLLL